MLRPIPKSPDVKEKVFSNVASCALQRWAHFSSQEGPDNERRSEEERRTFFMALQMLQKGLPDYP